MNGTSDDNLITDAQRREMLVRWNDTAVHVPAETLPDLFSRQVLRMPHAIALISGDSELTYAHVDARSNQLARLLINEGVGPETIVAVLLDRSPEMVIALLAILKAGGAYLPMEPDYPNERIKDILTDADPAVVVTSTALRRQGGSDSGMGSNLLELNDPAILDRLDTMDTSPVTDETRVARLLPLHPAYIFYTSGSTGRPKGVVVAHHAVTNYLATMQRRFGMTPADRVLLKTPFVFDLSVWEWIWPLSQGAVLIVARPGGHRDPDYLADLIYRAQVTIAQFVPSGLRAFLQSSYAGRCSCLRLVISGGEALPVDLRDRLHSILPITLHNMYGPTEATMNVTGWECDGDRDGAVVPIGRPLDNVRVYVLDDFLRPVAPGVAGELYVAGIQLARGYLNRAGLTAAKFVANPFEPGQRMYRTGDVAQWSAEGVLHYQGRTDRQIKIAGIRIEPGEVEHTMRAQPGVADATVVLVGERLVGYVVGTIDTWSLRTSLRRVLPDYMVPSDVVVLPSFPLTDSGKLDRAALPPPPAPASPRTYVPPSTPLQAALCALWQRHLGVERVGIDDDFFDLGGYSLLGLRLVADARDSLGIDLWLDTLLADRTIKTITASMTSIDTTSAHLDLSAECRLEPTIRGCGSRPRTGRILLTGATGFLGAFLLAELLRETHAQIVCLVRHTDHRDPAERLHDALAAYGIGDDSLWPRVTTVAGDLTALPDLPEVDLIIHSGSEVNLVLPYSRLRATNVEGVRALLALGAPMHYVSTASVPIPPVTEHSPLRPDILVASERLPDSGYVQSKWVAESLVMTANSRGIPAAIYRPSMITGHSETGVGGGKSAYWQFLRAVVSTGTAPDGLRWAENLVPVDFVARALVRLALSPESTGSVYHLTSETTIEFSDLVEHARSFGYPIRSIDSGAWFAEIAERVRHSTGGAAESVFGAVAVMLARLRGNLVVEARQYDTTATTAALAGSDITCPPVSAEVLNRYLRALIDTAELPPPRP